MPAATEPTSPDRAPRRDDAISTLASLLFITWCFVVGTLLLYAPWMPVWARITASFADPSLQGFLAHPTVRGAICGFGLFHLVYGTHDLDFLIGRFLHRRLEKLEADQAEVEGGESGRATGDRGGVEVEPAGEAGPDQPELTRRIEP